jgi:hypothetical protein
MSVKVGFRVFYARYLGLPATPPRDEDPLPQVHSREVIMEQSDKMKKVFKQLAISHFFEALIAMRAAKKRGKSPVKYFLLTWVFGVFVLVPLLRKPKLEKESQAVDI